MVPKKSLNYLQHGCTSVQDDPRVACLLTGAKLILVLFLRLCSAFQTCGSVLALCTQSAKPRPALGLNLPSDSTT